MSYIHVESVTHRGVPYEVGLCDPKARWGDKKGKFHIATPMVIDTGYYDTLDEVKKQTNASIDQWLDARPSTIEGWVDLLEKCMIWTGYEDCHLDREEAARILEKYKEG